MATRRLGIVMHGASGRIGTTQHLLNALVAIRQEGGLPLSSGDRLMPDPILVGRNPDKLRALAAGKHIYLEKPVADSLAEVLALRGEAEAAGRRHAVMQDKV